MQSPTGAPDGLPRRSFAIIFAVSLVTAMGNTGLISVLPAIGRTTGIPDEAAVAVFSLSALLWALTSPVWARASDRRGRKPLIVLGLAGFAVSMTLAGVVVAVGLSGAMPWLTLFLALLLARSLFGLFGSAAGPASQAYLAEYTPPEKRTAAISSLAGAWGLGTVLGPFLAPLLVLPLVGLCGPLFGFALVGFAVLFAVIRHLPESERRVAAGGGAASAQAPGGRPTPMWRDARVQPFLIFGFLTAACQTGQSQIMGFLVIDKLQMSPTAAQGFIAVAMMFGAMAGLLAQWGVIRMFDMTPRQLLRWGVAVAAAGNLMVAVSPDYWAVVIGFAIASLGFGFTRPGYSAGASLAVGLADQARAAGAITAVNGLNVMLAPLFVLFYRHLAWGPFVLNAVILSGLLVFALKNTQLRNADPRPATREDSALAAIERRDEGDVF